MLFPPFRVVLEREHPLHGLNATWPWFEQGFDRLTKLGDPPFGSMVGRPARGTVETVERGGEVENPAADLQEVAVKNVGEVAIPRHGERSPFGFERGRMKLVVVVTFCQLFHVEQVRQVWKGG